MGITFLCSDNSLVYPADRYVYTANINVLICIFIRLLHMLIRLIYMFLLYACTANSCDIMKLYYLFFDDLLFFRSVLHSI